MRKMEKSFEQYYDKINGKLEEIERKISFLQDLAIKTKTKLDLISNSIIKKNYISELTKIADEDLKSFLKSRPTDCRILDRCTTMIEKGTIKVLRIFIEKGVTAADELIDTYIEFANKPASIATCSDKLCLDKAMSIFNALKKLIQSVKKTESKSIEVLYKDNKFFDKLEGSKGESDLMSPLSNEKRIKILKILSNGKLLYNQIEDNVGIKGGPFHFHLKKLLEAQLVEQTSEKTYSITNKGTRALQLLFDFKEEFSLLD